MLFHFHEILIFLNIHFDVNVLPHYVAKGVPVFGICRGLQTLNVYFGGTLNQHINHEYSTKSRQELVHDIYIYRQGINIFTKNNKLGKVNSLHHQSIKDLGENLVKLAVSDDETVEAIKHRTLPIAAVQWHPEEIEDGFSEQLITNLLTINE